MKKISNNMKSMNVIVLMLYFNKLLTCNMLYIKFEYPNKTRIACINEISKQMKNP